MAKPQQLSKRQWKQNFEQLNDETSFSKNINLKLIADSFNQLLNHSFSHPLFSNAVQNQLNNSSTRSVFALMKWLICLHQMIDQCPNSQVANELAVFLHSLTPPNTLNKYEEYIKNKLLVPYQQYLIKLASIHQASHHSLVFPANVVFLKLNLLCFALSEFSIPIREFTKFFSRTYPLLNHYAALLASNTQIMYQQIKSSHSSKELESVKFLQIEQIGTKLAIFKPFQRANPAQDKEEGRLKQWLMTELPHFLDFQDLEGTYVPFV